MGCYDLLIEGEAIKAGTHGLHHSALLRYWREPEPKRK
jgi:hypothetical protein